MTTEIPSTKLKLSDVPLSSATWSEIARFALTFDGYSRWGSFEKCAEIANARNGRSLDELRTCLFFEQRRWRHFDKEPDAKAMTYIRSVLQNIRRCLAERE